MSPIRVNVQHPWGATAHQERVRITGTLLGLALQRSSRMKFLLGNKSLVGRVYDVEVAPTIMTYV